MNTKEPSDGLIASTSADVINLGEATQFSDSGIVSRKVLATPTTRVLLFGFAKGQELTEHASPSRAIVHILSGTCEFTAGGRPMTLTTGDLLHLPPLLPHSLVAVEKFSMMLTMIREQASEPQTC